MFIAIYVDDLLLVGKNIGEIDEVKKALSKHFCMTDLRACNFYLGIRIRQDHKARTIFLD